MILCFLFNPVQEYGLSLLNDGATGMNLRSMLCALLLLCYYTFLTFILGSAKNQVFFKSFLQDACVILYVHFILSGTGEGEVVEAERLLKPFRLRYPRVTYSNYLKKLYKNLSVFNYCPYWTRDYETFQSGFRAFRGTESAFILLSQFCWT